MKHYNSSQAIQATNGAWLEIRDAISFLPYPLNSAESLIVYYCWWLREAALRTDYQYAVAEKTP